jgi:hypothetical protein
MEKLLGKWPGIVSQPFALTAIRPILAIDGVRCAQARQFEKSQMNKY